MLLQSTIQYYKTLEEIGDKLDELSETICGLEDYDTKKELIKYYNNLRDAYAQLKYSSEELLDKLESMVELG